MQISSAPAFGNTEKHICELSSGLSAKGVDVRSILPTNCEWKNRMAAASFNEPYGANLSRSGRLLQGFRIAGIARELAPEIIHAHLPGDYGRAAIAARLCGASLVLSHHSAAPIPLATRLLVRKPGGLIATSYVACQTLTEHFGLARLTGIPAFASVLERTGDESKGLAASFRHKYGIGGERRVVAAVGGLSPGDDLILAANEVVRDLPDAYFVVVGWASGGDGLFRRRLRRLIKVFELEDNFLFLDKLEDLDHLLAAASAFVHASSSASAHLAALEAMAARVPVIAVRTGPEGVLIQEGMAALVSERNDAVALAANIKRIASDGVEFSRSLDSARQLAEQLLSREKIADSTLKVYEAALA
ncbi:MAG: glycosyltransferase family 4 protein [Aridibacter famidurans]|nr:glycosyltransferase family 4 protein [Aridibacter famidurans]